MLSDWPLVKTSPAIPRCDGERISAISPPAETREKRVLVVASNMKMVARSARSILVVSATTRCNSRERSNSWLISDTRPMNFISFWRNFSVRSMKCRLLSAMAACEVMSCSNSRSSAVNEPVFLFKHCIAPMTSPEASRIGTQMMLRVL